MRTYEQTHPHLVFDLDLRRASPRLWMLLGEAASKIEHLSNAPLLEETSAKLHRLYLAKGALATTAIEGNTLSEEEVLLAVDGKLQVPPSREYLKQEVDNILAAFRIISEQGAAAITPELICVDNRLVRDGLPQDESIEQPGRIRTHSVVVGRYRGAPAEDCPYLLRRLCDWMNESSGGPGPEAAHAIIRAVLGHLYIAWIHPFSDGNGRTARLLEFRILYAAGVPTPAIHLLSNHYNQTRSEYYRRLDLARQDVFAFIEYAVEGLVDGLKEQLKYVWAQQWQVFWNDYVTTIFGDKKGESNDRRRLLALAIGRAGRIRIDEIPEHSPQLARLYARKSAKTVARDAAALEELGLVRRENKEVVARREIVSGHMPSRLRKAVQEP